MPSPLSNDLRERLVRVVNGGMSRNAAAKHYQVSVSTVVKLMQRWQETGDFKPKPLCVYHGHKLSAHQQVVEKLLEDQNDLTLKEIQERLRQKKIIVSHMGVARFLEHIGQSYKKNSSRQRTEQAGRERGTRGMEEKPRKS